MNNPDKTKRGIRSAALICTVVVAAMVGVSFAAVPLYNMFCRVTGFGGTTQRAVSAPDHVVDRTITVRFDSTVSQRMPWHFKPLQREVQVKLGESKLVFYRAENLSDHPITGTASFNVTPDRAGSYFTKIQCFCFTEQTLQPGEAVDMPVTFYVDPEAVEDRSMDSVHTITLSYTFYPKKSEDQIAQGSKQN
ncbi:MAG: cytochrome c oxidase assembly protein [Alphaproteobacteria bacterium]|nr:MAG: cytochrome c oxidase assembly protein [Alphaproteobacteria bacterium]